MRFRKPKPRIFNSLGIGRKQSFFELLNKTFYIEGSNGEIRRFIRSPYFPNLQNKVVRKVISVQRIVCHIRYASILEATP